MVGSGKSDAVGFDEYHQALQLAVELRELPQGSQVQKHRALEGLAALVGAQVGLWVQTDGMSSGRVIIRRATDLGWSGAAERDAFLSYVESAQWVALDPSMPPLARLATTPFATFTRDQLLDDRAWYGSDHVQRFRRVARVDSFIYASYAPGGDAAACLSLHRAWGERAFSERERRVVDLFHRACRFLHESPSTIAPAIVRDLSPRLRQTLDGLARGRSEKQLAAELGLSPHRARLRQGATPSLRRPEPR